MRRGLSTENFLLGTQSLALRWRLADGKLPLRKRYLRALRARSVSGVDMGQFTDWAADRLDELTGSGCAGYPDGVALVMLDANGERMVTAVPYEPLPSVAAPALTDRAKKSYEEAQVTGVAAETLWTMRDGILLWGSERGFVPSAATGLLVELLRPLGITVTRASELHALVASDPQLAAQAFLVSDEHGIVCCESCGAMPRKLASSFEKHISAGRP